MTIEVVNIKNIVYNLIFKDVEEQASLLPTVVNFSLQCFSHTITASYRMNWKTRYHRHNFS
ncbi:MAG TPA: hypothetical protein PKY56_12745, partial [Candidatus Kapabacteria bacterium]|nr:hypothetical protein [Candidatus Kapabacteria bacterium]